MLQCLNVQPHTAAGLMIGLCISPQSLPLSGHSHELLTSVCISATLVSTGGAVYGPRREPLHFGADLNHVTCCMLHCVIVLPVVSLTVFRHRFVLQAVGLKVVRRKLLNESSAIHFWLLSLCHFRNVLYTTSPQEVNKQILIQAPVIPGHLAFLWL